MQYLLLLVGLTAVALVFPVWVWPWIGPMVLEPCPQFTPTGVWIFAVWWSLGVTFKQWGRDRVNEAKYRRQAGLS